MSTLTKTSFIPNHSTELIKKAEEQQLIYSTDTAPGITRVKNGKHFVYTNPRNTQITEQSTLQRINHLAIPPAWTNVWISPNPNTHIQATGRDEKGRKQYIYHPEWIRITQMDKFNKLLHFAEVLPSLRKEINAELASQTLTKKRVLSTVVWLLEHTYIRVGNQEYAKENDHYGLTTLRSKHLKVIGNTVKFEFTGKSGIFHEVDVHNPKVTRTLRKLDEIPGYELFKYISHGEKHLVTSEDINEFLRSTTAEDITAKDFRTWGGTVYAGEVLYNTGPGENKRQTKKNVTAAVKQVAKHLHNTPSTSRKYYIHPTIIDSYQNGLLIPHFDETKNRRNQRPKGFTFHEHATYTLLKTNSKQ